MFVHEDSIASPGMSVNTDNFYERTMLDPLNVQSCHGNSNLGKVTSSLKPSKKVKTITRGVGPMMVRKKNKDKDKDINNNAEETPERHHHHHHHIHQELDLHEKLSNALKEVFLTKHYFEDDDPSTAKGRRLQLFKLFYCSLFIL